MNFYVRGKDHGKPQNKGLKKRPTTLFLAASCEECGVYIKTKRLKRRPAASQHQGSAEAAAQYPCALLRCLAGEGNGITGIQPDLTLADTEVEVILRQRTTQYQLVTPKGYKKISLRFSFHHQSGIPKISGGQVGFPLWQNHVADTISLYLGLCGNCVSN